MIVSSLLYINLDVAKHTIADNDSESSSGVAPGITVIATAVIATRTQVIASTSCLCQ